MDCLSIWELMQFDILKNLSYSPSCSACSVGFFLHLISLLSQLEPAKELVRAAIQAGIMNDLGSGNNIDICVITKQGVDYIRPYQESQYRDNRYALISMN